MVGVLVLAALVAYIYITRVIVRKLPSRKLKYIVIAILVLIPTWDEVLGRVYLNHLCATEAGIKIYQIVEKPAELWDDQGMAKFITREGYLDFDEEMLGNQYYRKSVSQEMSDIIRITKKSYQLIGRNTKIVVGENVNFMFWGGWIDETFSGVRSAILCNRKQAGYFTDILKQAFKPSS